LPLDSVTDSKDKHREIPTDKGRGLDRMVAGIRTTYAISAYHH